MSVLNSPVKGAKTMRNVIFGVLVLLLVFFVNGTAIAGEKTATVAECIEMAEKAAAMILEDTDAALAEISRKDGMFVWKDSYVFAMNLQGRMLAHPQMPGLMKMGSLLLTPDKNVEEPKMLFVEFVVMASTKGEGWVEYMWPKPGSTTPSVKETYIYRVPDTNMFVGAGIYR
jgi:cytochrome c